MKKQDLKFYNYKFWVVELVNIRGTLFSRQDIIRNHAKNSRKRFQKSCSKFLRQQKNEVSEIIRNDIKNMNRKELKSEFYYRKHTLSKSLCRIAIF